MKKKRQFLLLFLSVIIWFSILSATEITTFANDGTIYYDIVDNEAHITYCDTQVSGNVVIPAFIEGYPVTTIADEAFLWCDKITSITLPDTVTAIGNEAFCHCSALEEIQLGNSLKTIGKTAFRGCSFNSIDLPDSLTTIGDEAFLYCTELGEITIPKNVNSIGERAFSLCSNLVAVYVNSENDYFSTDTFCVLYNKDKTTLVYYPTGNTRAGYTIPDTVRTIEAGVFRFCENIKNITIGKSVENIGDHAFSDCDSLKKITVSVENQHYYSDDFGVLYNKNQDTLIQYPAGSTHTEYTVAESTKTICAYSFSDATNLESVICKNVVKIEDYAFNGCECLEYIDLGNKIETIGVSAFDNCQSLSELVFPDSLISIADTAFFNCSSLNSVTVGKGLKSIGFWAFLYTSISDIYYAGSEEDWKNIDGYSELTASTMHYNHNPHTHSYSSSITESTCTENGYTTYTCSCGDTYTADEIPATGHTKATVKGYAATCTKTGLTDGEKCSVCGEVLTAQKEIPVLSHTFGEWVVATAPTASAEGIEERACNVCGKKETRAIEKLSYIVGDVNNDNEITAADARLALRISAGLDTLESVNAVLEMVDYNGDKQITAADARLILRKSAGLE
ncbi:MAG: leucine-rich repeat protein [Clostridia bacterium]|nr:leucine-rich repeat protein [Clostridia bacterium]